MIVGLGIFLVSAAALALELVLVRCLSIGQWYHFSYLVISTALLGFGGGASVIAIGSRFFVRHKLTFLWTFGLGLALSVPIVFLLSQRIPFDQLQLIWDKWRQSFYLSVYYMLFFIPFFFAGGFVGLSFAAFGHKAHRLYFFNMAGSGAGAAGALGLMYGNSPVLLLLFISFIGFLCCFILSFSLGRWYAFVTLTAGFVFLYCFSPAGPIELSINISEHKALTYYRNLPRARIVARRYSPLARIDCVKADAIREFAGLSMAYQGNLPEQMVIITDGDGVSAVNHFRQREDLRCYDYLTSALGYHLQKNPAVCVIGAGGGSDVCQALYAGTPNVTAVEMNPQVIELMRGKLNDFASGLYKRDDVEIVLRQGRTFLQRTKRKFDIIKISLLDSYSASAAGLYALNESHLYTVQAMQDSFAKLSRDGILSVTRLLKTPPRDSLKMLATIAEALRRAGREPSKHIMMIRSLSTATIVSSPKPFTEEQIKKARDFTEARRFDVVYLPGVTRKEVNRFNELEEGPIYYECANRILSGNYREFYSDYAYDIRPATDDRPYFFDFFKWESIPRMRREIPGQWLIFSQWGYLVLVACFIQALLASMIFILLPLRIARPIRLVRRGKFPVLFYFILLGVAYMFLEMGFIQKLSLLIGHPVFGVAVALVGFLFFSGCGAYFAEKLMLRIRPRQLICFAVALIILIGISEIVLFYFGFDLLVGFSMWQRILLSLGIVALPGFFMGMPLPTALRQVHARMEPLVPWAWGANGFASVTAAVLGTLLAISIGFRLVILSALVCYFIAGFVFMRHQSDTS